MRRDTAPAAPDPLGAAADVRDRQQRVGDLLASVEWDFSTDQTPEPLHNIHPYPAKFIPEIPRALIRLFGKGDTVVLDPFCGSGTTLVEAQRAGLASVGVDLHPLGALISSVKTGGVVPDLGHLAVEIAEKAAACQDAPIPDIPRLDHWFHPDVQVALANLVSHIGQVACTSARAALRVALSRIIVAVSNQESDTRYAAVKKDIGADEVYWRFLRAARSVEAGLIRAGAPSARAQIVQKDILKVSAKDIGVASIGLVITSPPYPNAYEYWLYHKYRMYWLGMDPLAVRNAEIGARPHYFKKDPQTERDFEDQMRTCFQLLAAVTVTDAHVCFIVGRSIIHGRRIDNAVLLKRAAASAGFVPLGDVTRRIRQSRKSFNPVNGAINEETLLVFGREADQ